MLYPNNIKKTFTKEVNYKNRGMDLEYIIEKSNIYYRNQDIAYIYKKPTPIHVVKTQITNKGKKITEAFYEVPSTLDFNGIYKGHYIEFDAKVTNNKTSFPLSNVHDHQIKHLINITKHQGLAFLIIKMNEKYFLLTAQKIIEFLNKESRKSIPYQYILDNAYELKITLNGLEYIHIVDKIIGGNL